MYNLYKVPKNHQYMFASLKQYFINKLHVDVTCKFSYGN